MVRHDLSYLFTLIFFGVANLSCNQNTDVVKPIYKFSKAQYEGIVINDASDTLSFLLDEHTYNDIKSFNLFFSDNREFISFFDRGSNSIILYDFQTKKLVKRISLKKCFKDQPLYKTSVYTRNFDSIWITNKTKIYLIDSSGTVHNSIEFLKKPKYAWAVLENTSPPYFLNGQLYAGVRPYVKTSSSEALKQWRVMYVFDFKNRKVNLKYPLPELYTRNYYGSYFLDYSYCYNDRGNFVFSFPADTNLYETNLTDYHIAYSARSQYQAGSILPLGKSFVEGENETEQFYTRDSYGPIFYDFNKRRYLRLVKQKISQADYSNKYRKRKQSIIIMDSTFRIIGESVIDNSLALNTLFFDSKGDMFVRVNSKDEYALHFSRLIYTDDNSESRHLARGTQGLGF